MTTRDIRFEMVLYGIDQETKIPAKVHFQSQACYDQYVKGKLDRILGMTLISPDNTEELVFWFDDNESKQKWMNEELKIVKRKNKKK